MNIHVLPLSYSLTHSSSPHVEWRFCVSLSSPPSVHYLYLLACGLWLSPSIHLLLWLAKECGYPSETLLCNNKTIHSAASSGRESQWNGIQEIWINFKVHFAFVLVSIVGPCFVSSGGGCKSFLSIPCPLIDGHNLLLCREPLRTLLQLSTGNWSTAWLTAEWVAWSFALLSCWRPASSSQYFSWRVTLGTRLSLLDCLCW